MGVRIPPSPPNFRKDDRTGIVPVLKTVARILFRWGFKSLSFRKYAGVTQLAEGPDLESGGWRFESSLPYFWGGRPSGRGTRLKPVLIDRIGEYVTLDAMAQGRCGRADLATSVAMHKKQRPSARPVTGQGNGWPLFVSNRNYYFFIRFFLPRPTSPIKPTPSSTMVPGSGTAPESLGL